MNSHHQRVQKDSAPRAGENAGNGGGSGGVDSHLGCRRVLVVEDGRRLREMLVDAVGFMGMEPEGAPTAEAAVEMLDRNLYTTAILDLNLPGMGGLELCEIIRQRWPHVQIIVLTAFGNLEAARRAIRLDVVDFLTKPCGMNDLEIALGRARQRWIEHCPSAEPISEIEQRASEAHIETPTPSQGVSMEEMERQTIFAALSRHGGSREAAAAELGISVRKLYYRLQQYQREGFVPIR
jgi:DNA-binding NtrC family response regulator